MCKNRGQLFHSACFVPLDSLKGLFFEERDSKKDLYHSIHT